MNILRTLFGVQKRRKRRKRTEHFAYTLNMFNKPEILNHKKTQITELEAIIAKSPGDEAMPRWQEALAKLKTQQAKWIIAQEIDVIKDAILIFYEGQVNQWVRGVKYWKDLNNAAKITWAQAILDKAYTEQKKMITEDKRLSVIWFLTRRIKEFTGLADSNKATHPHISTRYYGWAQGMNDALQRIDAGSVAAQESAKIAAAAAIKQREAIAKATAAAAAAKAAEAKRLAALVAAEKAKAAAATTAAAKAAATKRAAELEAAAKARAIVAAKILAAAVAAKKAQEEGAKTIAEQQQKTEAIAKAKAAAVAAAAATMAKITEAKRIAEVAAVAKAKAEATTAAELAAAEKRASELEAEKRAAASEAANQQRLELAAIAEEKIAVQKAQDESAAIPAVSKERAIVTDDAPYEDDALDDMPYEDELIDDAPYEDELIEDELIDDTTSQETEEISITVKMQTLWETNKPLMIGLIIFLIIMLLGLGFLVYTKMKKKGKSGRSKRRLK